MVLPIIVVLFALVGYPFVQAIWVSLHFKVIGVDSAPFIGLGNYVKLVRDPGVREAVLVTVIYAVGAVAGKVVLGLLTALLLNEDLPARALLRAIVILPWCLPTATTALAFKWILSGGNGILNYILRQVGWISENIIWLGSRGWALGTVIGVNIWRGFPFFAICLLAGLQSISKDLYEAATVDGASAAQRFWHVTVPGIVPVLAVTTLLSLIWTINDFGLLWVMTKGGPSAVTTTLPVLTYRTAFISNELGKAVATSVLLVPAVIVLISALVRALSRREEP